MKKLFNIKTKLSCYKFFSEHLLLIEYEKNEILKNKPVYLGLSVLE